MSYSEWDLFFLLSPKTGTKIDEIEQLYSSVNEQCSLEQMWTAAIIWNQGLVGQRSPIRVAKITYFEKEWHFCALPYPNSVQLGISPLFKIQAVLCPLKANIASHLQVTALIGLVFDKPGPLESECTERSPDWGFGQAPSLPQKMTRPFLKVA